jgi:hypothetical protein
MSTEYERVKERRELTQYHTPYIRVIIEIDGVPSVWDWPPDALIPLGPRLMPEHTAFHFDILAYTRRLQHSRLAASVPAPLGCKDYSDGEYICGLSADQEE